jgi:hypothetical protein
MSVFSYGASDDQTYEDKVLSAIVKSPLEKELIDTGRYALFKMVHKLYDMIELNASPNKKLIPEFKKNAGLGLYLVFDDYCITNPTDICMPWGRIYLSLRYTSEQKKKIASILRQRLKVRHISFYENFSCYQVFQIEDDSMPHQEERESEKGRCITDINKEWNILSSMYLQEKNIYWLNEYKEFYASKSREFYGVQSRG